MVGKFRGWIPNATGNLSFSFIGIDGQPTVCHSAHGFNSACRKVVAVQRRNLSDNLLAKHVANTAAVHKFDFTMLARTCAHNQDILGALRGWILVHEVSPLDVSQVDGDGIEVRGLKSAMATSALFVVSFRLYRSGRMDLRTPPRPGLLDVRYGKQVPLNGQEALRPLVAQCFYFLRDITHRHQHHSNHSDTITTVWPVTDSSQWIRETLYEFYRRVLMLRRQRSPRGQEDALGMLAYIGAFENIIAGPYRSANPGAGIPTYDKSALKDSLTATLETKRRKRVQTNVVAAVIPAFAAAMLALANQIYGQDVTFVRTEDLADAMVAFSEAPISVVIGTLQLNQWLFPAVVALGFVWVASFAGVVQPTERLRIKGIAQAAAVWGAVKSALVMGLFALLTVLAIIALFRL